MVTNVKLMERTRQIPVNQELMKIRQDRLLVTDVTALRADPSSLKSTGQRVCIRVPSSTSIIG
uniref:Uncharacterized protein n=1 Tax=Arion vulgaris TaxID=1028688 RepID=A0A0B7B1P9_9EUPU